MIGERGRILVVDDEESIRKLLQRILKEAGYIVATAATGREALEKVTKQKTELMLLDIKMPGISGMKILRQLTSKHPDVSVVMATASNDAQTAVEAMKLGAYDYITKPFKPDDVVLSVQRAIEKKQLLLENERQQLELQNGVREQTERLQRQFEDLLETLAREHRTSEIAIPTQNAKLSDKEKTERKSNETIVEKRAESIPEQEDSVEEKIEESAQPLEKTTGEQVTDPIPQSEGAIEEKAEETNQPQRGATNYKVAEQKEVTSFSQPNMDIKTLYSGEIELVITSTAELKLVSALYNYLQTIPELRILSTRGSWNEGTSMIIAFENEMPLIDILLKLPDVEVIPESISTGVISAGKAGSTFGNAKKEMFKIKITLKEIPST